jgi:hypothetical protein
VLISGAGYRFVPESRHCGGFRVARCRILPGRSVVYERTPSGHDDRHRAVASTDGLPDHAGELSCEPNLARVAHDTVVTVKVVTPTAAHAAVGVTVLRIGDNPAASYYSSWVAHSPNTITVGRSASVLWCAQGLWRWSPAAMT